MTYAFQPINTAPNQGVQLVAILNGETLTIRNDSTTTATITAIYFEGGEEPVFDNPPGVIFESDTGTLPAAHLVEFRPQYAFKAAPPPPKNGLNPGESMTLEVTGTERIGLHVQGIGEAKDIGQLHRPATSSPCRNHQAPSCWHVRPPC